MYQITSAMKEYIKTIFSIERNGDVAKTTELAKKLNVKPASVTEMTRKMGERGLLCYKPYHQMRLTERGSDAATKILRQHRLLEKLFVDFLGLDAASACSESSKLELLLSDHATNRICAVFNHPTTCPCGKPIFSDERCCGR